MRHLQVFTDASVNTQLQVGYGAYLVVSEQNIPAVHLKHNVKAKRFDKTSSTKLELQTLLWAIDDILQWANIQDLSLTIYTDCQNIISLPDRLARLEGQGYLNSKNKPLNNAELYQDFYCVTAAIMCKFVKVAGHKVTAQKDEFDKLSSLVDKASRLALRNEFHG